VFFNLVITAGFTNQFRLGRRLSLERQIERMMRTMKLFLTTVVAVLGAAAAAFAQAVTEAPTVMSPDQTGGADVPSWVIPVVIFSLLFGAAALSGDSDGSEAS
jgi:hypothetical protein